MGNWGSKKLDFYTSTGQPLSSGTRSFTYQSTWDSERLPDAARKDKHWGNYQSLNLLTDTSGSVYLIGFHRERGNDYADLFEISLAGMALHSRK